MLLGAKMRFCVLRLEVLLWNEVSLLYCRSSVEIITLTVARQVVKYVIRSIFTFLYL
jgi:hypothetical protein